MLDLVDFKHGQMRDRRAFPRVRIDRPCKLFDPRAEKYLPASTRDLSAGGVLLKLDRPLAIGPGEEVFVGVAQKRRQMFLRSSEMIRARVVRAFTSTAGQTAIAVRWVDEAASQEPLRRAA